VIGPCFGCGRERSVEPVGGGEYLCAECIAQRKRSGAGSTEPVPVCDVCEWARPDCRCVRAGEGGAR
jgi:hypothetical protein